MVESFTNPPKGSFFLGPDGLIRPAWRVMVFLFLSIGILWMITGAMRGVPGGAPGLRLTVFYVAATGALLIESWFLLSVFDRRRFQSLGLWTYPGYWQEWLIGAGIGLVVVAVVSISLIVGGLVRYDGWGKGPLMAGLLSALALIMIQSLFEEVAFRGYGFQRLIDSAGVVGATLITAGIFGAGHALNPSATALSTLNTVLAGILLALAYVKTRGLWLPWGLHWAWNFFLGPVFSLPVSGVTLWAEMLRAQVGGPEWLSGGKYGPESSVILTVLCSAAIAWLWRTRRVGVSPATQQNAGGQEVEKSGGQDKPAAGSPLSLS